MSTSGVEAKARAVGCSTAVHALSSLLPADLAEQIVKSASVYYRYDRQLEVMLEQACGSYTINTALGSNEEYQSYHCPRYVVIQWAQGRIIADTERTKRGKYRVTWETSVNLRVLQRKLRATDLQLLIHRVVERVKKEWFVFGEDRTTHLYRSWAGGGRGFEFCPLKPHQLPARVTDTQRCQSTIDWSPDKYCCHSKLDGREYCLRHCEFPHLGRNLRDFVSEPLASGQPALYAEFVRRYYPNARPDISGSRRLAAYLRHLAAHFMGAELGSLFPESEIV